MILFPIKLMAYPIAFAYVAAKRLLKLDPHKFFRATSRTIKYALVCYGILHGLLGGLSLAGPASLFTTRFYRPVILGNSNNMLLAAPTLAGLWLLNHLLGKLVTNLKFFLQLLVILAVMAAGMLLFWWLFVKPVGA